MSIINIKENTSDPEVRSIEITFSEGHSSPLTVLHEVKHKLFDVYCGTYDQIVIRKEK